MLKKYIYLNLCITQDVFKIWKFTLNIDGENQRHGLLSENYKFLGSEID